MFELNDKTDNNSTYCKLFKRQKINNYIVNPAQKHKYLIFFNVGSTFYGRKKTLTFQFHHKIKD